MTRSVLVARLLCLALAAPLPLAAEEAEGDEAVLVEDETMDEAMVDEATVDEGTDDEDRALEAEESIIVVGRSGKVARVAGSAHRVDEETLEKQEYDDVHRILKQVPGVYVREEDGFGLRPNIGLRGANSDRSAKITLMEDGVLLAPAPYAAPAAYYFPLTTRLTGVEVFKGPAAIKHGPNTIGGAVNLITRSVPAQGVKAMVDVSGGMRNSAKAHAFVGFGERLYGLVLEGAFLRSDGFKELDGGGATGFDKYDLMAKFRINNDPGAQVHHRLDLKVGYGDEASRETYLGLTDKDFENTPYRRYAASQLARMKWGRSQVKASYTTYVGMDLELRLTAYRHDFDRSWKKLNSFGSLVSTSVAEVLSDPQSPQNRLFYEVLSGTNEWTGDPSERLAIGTNQRTYVSQGVALKADWRAGPKDYKNHLQVGVRLHADEVARLHTQGEYDMREGRVEQVTDDATTKENLGQAQAIAVYGFDELKLWKTLHLTPGLRVEIIESTLDDDLAESSTSNRSTVLLPGMGAWYAFNERWGVLAGVHRGFSPLAPGQSDDIDPESSINYEAGIRWSYPRVVGELIGFYNRYENLVGTCTQSAGCAQADVDAQFNAGEADILGLETVIQTRLALGAGFQGDSSATYTLTQARFAGAFESGFGQWGEVEEGDALPYVPEQQAALEWSITKGPWRLGTTASYVGPMRDVAGRGDIPDAQRIDGHFILDLNGAYHFDHWGKLYATADNVLQDDYLVSRRPFGARPGKPFHAQLGYKHFF